MKTIAHSVYKVVCASCNQNWMSTLENSVSRILKPLLTDKRATLRITDAAQIETLATWVSHRAILSDYANNPEPFYSETERRVFKGHPAPLANISIWISFSSFGVCQNRSDVVGPITSPAGEWRGTVMLYQLGHFICEAACTRWVDPNRHDPAPDPPGPGEWVNYISRVWPVRFLPLTLPPYTLSLRDLKRFAYRWRPPGTPPIPGDPLLGG